MIETDMTLVDVILDLLVRNHSIKREIACTLLLESYKFFGLNIKDRNGTETR